MTTLRDDVVALAGMTRDSAGDGELRAAKYVFRRLGGVGVGDLRILHHRGQRTYAWAHALPALGGLIASRLARARWRLALGALSLGLLELDASGRAQPLRRMLPAGEGAIVLGSVEPRGEVRRTVVVVAHHDAARTGLVWHPALARADRVRRLQTRSMGAFMAPTAAGLALAAAPSRWLRRMGRALLGASVAADVQIALSPTVPGACDNATGVAALIALAADYARRPFEHTQVVFASVGCEESGMEGMRAALHHLDLDPHRSFVVGLDTLGAGTPIVASAEGTMLAHAYDPQALALVDAGAALAGVPLPQRWRLGGWTDPILAVFAGIPAVSLLSVGPDGGFTDYHLPTDTVDRVDWASVEACLALARGTVDAAARI